MPVKFSCASLNIARVSLICVKSLPNNNGDLTHLWDMKMDCCSFKKVVAWVLS